MPISVNEKAKLAHPALAIKPKPLCAMCKACQGTGQASNGSRCYPCDGRGWKVFFRDTVVSKKGK